MNCFMGIDIGTSGCKALIFDESGRQLSESSRPYEIISKRSGWAELDIGQKKLQPDVPFPGVCIIY